MSTKPVKQYVIILGSRASCAFCRRRLVIRWTDGNHYSIWACIWHTRRAWKILKERES